MFPFPTVSLYPLLCSGNPNAVNDTEKYGYQDQEQHFALVGVWADYTGKYRLNPLPAYYYVQRYK